MQKKQIMTMKFHFNCLFKNIMAILSFLSALLIICLYSSNIFTTLYRLGNGLAKRDIAVFDENGSYESLRDSLVDSKLFKSKRIHQIHKNSIDKARKYSIFLVHYSIYQNELDKILALKDDSTALIVYAPQSEGRVSDVDMNKINDKRNAIVVNFRGRLINDILISLMTTSF